MDTTDSLLIVGAGSAGAELAVSARQNGWAGSITLIGDEVHLPYHRPPLSKAYLSGKADADSLSIRPTEAYAKAGITLRLGTHAIAIDRENKSLQLANGERLDYTKLALCLGGRARPMVVDGLVESRRPSNLHYLRSRADADAIRVNLTPGSRLVVIGGGYVGLEVAASARALGTGVTILEAQPRVLARVTGPEVSAFYEKVHRDAGVDVRTGVNVARIECVCEGAAADDCVARAVVLAGGESIDADVLVVGVGGLPNVELAAAAGLEVDSGIVVNEFAQTSDRHIYAAGDCTLHPSAIYGRRLRLESVPNALEQARAAAASLCGKSKAHDSVPWFWSDQYDLKLQMVGLSEGYDRFVLRGSFEARSFVAFYLREGRLLAADAVNRSGDFMVAKRLVASRSVPDAARLADESVPLKAFLMQAG
jgi:3-phenylpropionate/trans-cinnamate dioxygenase ferredoxin reductase component